jgi:putative membrane protein
MKELGDLLAAFNAGLNSASTVLLLIGWMAVRRGDREMHRKCMVSALGVSALFLVSYLTRVALTGTHRYPGTGALRAIYLGLLGSHMLLAMLTPPLVLRALYLALRQRFAEHRRLVRYAYPIWMYVSVTGVLVYWMLYHGPHGLS